MYLWLFRHDNSLAGTWTFRNQCQRRLILECLVKWSNSHMNLHFSMSSGSDGSSFVSFTPGPYKAIFCHGQTNLFDTEYQVVLDLISQEPGSGMGSLFFPSFVRTTWQMLACWTGQETWVARSAGKLVVGIPSSAQQPGVLRSLDQCSINPS